MVNSLVQYNMKLLLLTYLLFFELNVILSCIHSENVECSCTTDEIECFGLGEDPIEIQQLFRNISLLHPSGYLESLILNLTNISFSTDLNSTRLKIRNLTIGGLQGLPENLLDESWENLQFLKIQNNSIKFIANQPFSALLNLAELYLDSNEITDIKSDAFFNLSTLQFLSISRNQLTKVDEDFLLYLPLLHVLLLNDNNISHISNIKVMSSSLTTLSVHNCHIEGSLNETSLFGLPHLTFIDLSSNQLNAVDSHALSALQDIKILNISKNVIHKLEEYAFSKLHNLEVLDLSRNEISFIKRTAFSKLSNLKHLDLSGNMLKAMLCEYTCDLHSLEKVDLRDNGIKTITAGTFLYSPSIQELLLKGNTLDEIDAVICSPLPNITVMFIDIDFQSKNCDIFEPCGLFGNEVETDEDYDDDTDSTPISKTSLDEFSAEETTIVSSSLITTTKHTTEENKITDNDTAVSTTHLLDTTAIQFSTSSPFITTKHTTEEEDIITDNGTAVSTTHSLDTAAIQSSTSSPFTTAKHTTEEDTITDNSAAVLTTHSLDSTVIHSSTSSPFTTTKNSTGEDIIDNGTVVSTTHSLDTTIIQSFRSSPFPTTNIIPTVEGDKSTEVSTISSQFSDESTAAEIDISFITTHSTPISNTEDTSDYEDYDYSSAITSTNSGLTTKVFGSSTPATISIKNYTFTDKKLCFKYEITGMPSSELRCSLKYQSIKGRKSLHLVCPKKGISAENCFEIDDIYDFCLQLYIGDLRVDKSCNKIQSPTPITESQNTSTSPSPTTPASVTTTPASVTTTPIPINSKQTPIISSHFPFKILSFDVFFNDSNSAVAVWTVNTYQDHSECNLSLATTSANLKTLENVFGCTNNTYRIKLLQENDVHEICLLSYHKKYGTETKCKRNLAVLYGASTSKKKDNGYKNSSLFALSILLLVVLAIIILLVIRNLLKKRLDRDRYNVYIEEQNVQKRTSTLYQEPSVRYSYTPKE